MTTNGWCSRHKIKSIRPLLAVSAFYWIHGCAQSVQWQQDLILHWNTDVDRSQLKVTVCIFVPDFGTQQLYCAYHNHQNQSLLLLSRINVCQMLLNSPAKQHSFNGLFQDNLVKPVPEGTCTPFQILLKTRAVSRNPAFFPNPAPAKIPPEPDTFAGFGKYTEVRPFL